MARKYLMKIFMMWFFNKNFFQETHGYLGKGSVKYGQKHNEF